MKHDVKLMCFYLVMTLKTWSTRDSL